MAKEASSAILGEVPDLRSTGLAWVTCPLLRQWLPKEKPALIGQAYVIFSPYD